MGVSYLVAQPTNRAARTADGTFIEIKLQRMGDFVRLRGEDVRLLDLHPVSNEFELAYYPWEDISCPVQWIEIAKRISDSHVALYRSAQQICRPSCQYLPLIVTLPDDGSSYPRQSNLGYVIISKEQSFSHYALQPVAFLGEILDITATLIFIPIAAFKQI